MGSMFTSTSIASFGEFEANLHSRELLRNGCKVRLTDQSFCVLAMLLERPSELVTREEIAKRLWPTDTFVDFDHGLNNAVNRLREALGDSADSPRFIETLPRRGYRFIAKTSGIRPVAAVSQLVSLAPDAATARPVFINRQATFPIPKRHRWLLWAIPMFAALAVLVAAKLVRAPFPPSSRSFILPPAGTTFDLIGDSGGSVALSTDGTKLAFVAVDSKAEALVWVRELSKLSADPIEGTEGASFPFWSPDGRSIGFFADGKLKKIRLDGGPAVALAEAPFGRGGDWNARGVIIFAPASHSGIYRVSELGGVATPITTVDATIHTTHRWPKFLPDDEHFIYLAANHFDDASHNGVYRASLDGKENEFLIATNADATYESGYLFFMRKDVLMAQRFDPRRGRFEGEARPTVEKVLYDSSVWKAVFDASGNGVLAYQLGVKTEGTKLLWYDRSGKELGTVGEPNYYWDPRLSRDGRKLTFGMLKQKVGYSDLWVYDFGRDIKTQITFNKYDNGNGILSPNNSQVIFASKREHYSLYIANAGGAEIPRLLLDRGSDAWPVDLSPDGRFLLFAQGYLIGRAQSQLWVYTMNGSTAPYRLLEGDALEADAQFSPDGRWVAYSSNESGRDEVYVIAFTTSSTSGKREATPVSRRWRVSSAGGYRPRWCRDGRELIYVNDANVLVVVDVFSKGSGFKVGEAHPLFHANTLADRRSVYYDVTRDGNKILVSVATPERAAPITLVENWPSDFAK
jgi:DNA-binding winged helix-turn-helix (wHTH) protein/Tol biopolymer transport system component